MLLLRSSNCETDHSSRRALLDDIEAGMPFLFVDQLMSQALVAGAEGGPTRVLYQYLVYGPER